MSEPDPVAALLEEIRRACAELEAKPKPIELPCYQSRARRMI